jgi:hypothetical protein
MLKPCVKNTIHFKIFKGNTYVATNLSRPTLKYINRMEYDILEMCDGSNSITDIGYKLSQDYKANVNIKDINTTIEKFSWLLI